MNTIAIVIAATSGGISDKDAAHASGKGRTSALLTEKELLVMNEVAFADHVTANAANLKLPWVKSSRGTISLA